ncbi:MAG: TrmB family transcriptional regulator [Candidatus Hodarchaeales archaeon]
MTDKNTDMLKNYEDRENFQIIKEKLGSLFDISEKETSVYLLLLTHKNLTANEISRIARIQRTRVYEIFRNLKTKGLVELSSENPKRFNAISPRIAIDNWIFNRKRHFEKKSSMLLDLLPTLMKIWKNQHQETLSNRVSLISVDLIKEVIPQEMKIAQKNLYLALRDPVQDVSTFTSVHTELFEPYAISKAIQSFLRRGVLLHILIGDPEFFLKNAHPIMLKTLMNGLIEGTIEVRTLHHHFPQSFLLVDDNLVYIFFLSSSQNTYNEALRAESKSLRDLFRLVWEKFWEEATPINLDSVLKMVEAKKNKG